MVQKISKRIYAALFLLILLTAHLGQQVHIYNETAENFQRLDSRMVPGQGDGTGVSRVCIVDNYYFFPFLEFTPQAHVFYSEQLAVLHSTPVQCPCCEKQRGVCLRAPPVA